MGGGDLNLKKSWHPHTMKNQERVWKAEQAKQEEQRKLDDLRKEITEERDREELRRLGENSGVLASSNGIGGEAKLEWMYKNSAELINREEYLLGRKIDKSFEQLQSEERRQDQSTVGLKQSINHVEHECVPFSIREYRNLQSTEQVDMQRKTMEDPLMLIKQREMESRRKLLENPVKLKEIHRILKTEQEQATKRNKKSKKSTKSKRRKHKKRSSDYDDDDYYKSNDNDNSADSDSDDDLDRKLARQVKKLKGETSNGGFKLDKLLDAKYRTLTKQLDMATRQKSKKKSRHCRDSSNDSASSQDERMQQRREQRGRRDRSNSSGYERIQQTRDQERRRVSGNERFGQIREQRGRRDRSVSNSRADERVKQTREHRRRRDRSSSSGNERARQSREQRRRRDRSRSNSRADERAKQTRELRGRRGSRDERTKRREQEDLRRHWHSRSRTPRRGQQQQQRRRSHSRERRQRAPTPEKQQAQQQQRRNASPTERKPKAKLSETEREARLREMMDNATWREADRTRAVHKHREEYAREEAQNQARDFDKQFINKEVKKALDNQTSIGNRIRSNLNNIQRTSAAMDANFARK